MPTNKKYFDPMTTNSVSHSMGDSIFRYLEMKIHTSIDFKYIKRIKITGKFDRTYAISNNEKRGKSFNYMCPTARIIGDEAEILCFPGIDYVFHFSNIYSSFVSLVDSSAQVICDLPDESICWNEICKSSLSNIPKIDTVIMEYVEGLEYLSFDKVWLGDGNFLYKRIRTRSGEPTAWM